MTNKMLFFLLVSVFACQATDFSHFPKLKPAFGKLSLIKPSFPLGKFKTHQANDSPIITSPSLDQALADIHDMNATMIDDANKIVQTAEDAFIKFEQQLHDITSSAATSLREKLQILLSHAQGTVVAGVDLDLEVEDCLTEAPEDLQGLTNDAIAAFDAYSFKYQEDGRHIVNSATEQVMGSLTFVNQFEGFYQQCLNLEDASEQEECAEFISTATKFFKYAYVYSIQRFMAMTILNLDQFANDLKKAIVIFTKDYHDGGSTIVDGTLGCVVNALKA